LEVVDRWKAIERMDSFDIMVSSRIRALTSCGNSSYKPRREWWDSECKFVSCEQTPMGNPTQEEGLSFPVKTVQLYSRLCKAGLHDIF